jgi:Ca2+-binding RTX toxin-like protein
VRPAGTLGSTTVSARGAWSWTFIGSSSTPARTLTTAAADVAGNKSQGAGTVVVGSSRAESLVSSVGNDFMFGGSGADTFVFGPLAGHDIIEDFVATGTGHDVIDFHGMSTLKTYATIMSHATQTASGTVITLDSNNSLMLANVARSSLTSADFTFV